MSTTAPIAIILNAAAGDGTAEKTRDRVEELCAAAGRAVDVRLSHDGGELAAEIALALDRNPVALVAGGGDGTVNAVACALIGRDIPLGILPLGTLNHFAKDLGLPLELDAAVGVLLAGHTTTVDVGEVNGKFFLNNSSLGLYPKIVRLRQRYQAHGLKKWLVALWITSRLLKRNPRLAVSIEVDGQKVLYRSPIVFVGNNEYGMSGLEAGSRKSLSDGVLAIYVVKAGRKWRLMRLAWRMFTGRALRGNELELLTTTRATIDFRKSPQPVALDGEVAELETPLEYSTRPAALRVLVPAAEAAAAPAKLAKSA